MQKKLLVTAVAAAMALPTVAMALDTKVSGHVNRMIRFADNGAGSDVQHIDNTASGSRFRFNTSGSIGSGITGGIIFEAGFQSNTSGSTALKAADGTTNSVLMRHSAIYFEGNFGRVTLGQTSEASDGMLFADLSGTGFGDEVSTIEHGSGIALVLDDTETDLTLGDAIKAPDGGRTDTLRYDTPSLGGIGKIAVSVSNDERWAAAAYLGGNAGGGEWQLNAGYTRLGRGNNDADEYGISASYLFSQGTNITLAYGNRDLDGPEQDIFYGKLGHKFGNTAVSVSYGTGTTEGVTVAKGSDASVGIDDETGGVIVNPAVAAVTDDVDFDVFGVGIVHNLQGGASVYAGYTLAMVEGDDAGDFDDVNMFVVGGRITFN